MTEGFVVETGTVRTSFLHFVLTISKSAWPFLFSLRGPGNCLICGIF
ncbi:unnamed protein product [Acanthoscelides obtectus]|uniref:Uncharacterized protein n=1 Tax=Acanthoscelides obtectus TaxID=200917 RepID=A0A9P0LBM0_ACAOB|nr:unnamed protein product [Acanthoscelides obtectus]CAK1658925.1 hypothetical protein AOBTE_LOCUS21203 [Acanthoscelides obtectus]